MTSHAVPPPRAELRRILSSLLAAATFESSVLIVHALYGARRYENASLNHVVIPALFWLALAVALAGAYAWRPSTPKRWLLVALVGLPYLVLFGLIHGAIVHGLKLVLYAAGTAPESLARLFAFGDFVVPDDTFFELTGLGTFFSALIVGGCLLRFLRATKRSRAVTSLPAPPAEHPSPASES
jgi:hypothetical protein